MAKDMTTSELQTLITKAEMFDRIHQSAKARGFLSKSGWVVIETSAKEILNAISELQRSNDKAKEASANYGKELQDLFPGEIIGNPMDFAIANLKKLPKLQRQAEAYQLLCEFGNKEKLFEGYDVNHEKDIAKVFEMEIRYMKENGEKLKTHIENLEAADKKLTAERDDLHSRLIDASDRIITEIERNAKLKKELQQANGDIGRLTDYLSKVIGITIGDGNAVTLAMQKLSQFKYAREDLQKLQQYLRGHHGATEAGTENTVDYAMVKLADLLESEKQKASLINWNKELHAEYTELFPDDKRGGNIHALVLKKLKELNEQKDLLIGMNKGLQKAYADMFPEEDLSDVIFHDLVRNKLERLLKLRDYWKKESKESEKNADELHGELLRWKGIACQYEGKFKAVRKEAGEWKRIAEKNKQTALLHKQDASYQARDAAAYELKAKQLEDELKAAVRKGSDAFDEVDELKTKLESLKSAETDCNRRLELARGIVSKLAVLKTGDANSLQLGVSILADVMGLKKSLNNSGVILSNRAEVKHV